MRFYKIAIQTVAGKEITYSSLDSAGGNNGSALRVDLDLFETLFHQPSPNSILRIYGVPYKDLGQLADLNPSYKTSGNKFSKIKISVGMSKGLPFAKPYQAGLIIDGIIEYAFANWQGAEICLDLIVNSNFGTTFSRPNLSWAWEDGQTLQEAVTETLQIAYKDSNPVITGGFSDTLKYTETQPGIYPDIYSFSKYVNKVSKTINPNPEYIGATIAPTPDGFILNDGTALSNNLIQILYTDMIGNPTWKAPGIIQAKVTMRGDMSINDYIIFPKLTTAINNANSTQQVRNLIPFQGYFQIISIRHIGNNRQATGDSWCTVIDCVVTNNIPNAVRNLPIVII